MVVSTVEVEAVVVGVVGVERARLCAMGRVNERMVAEACGCVGWVERLGGKGAG